MNEIKKEPLNLSRRNFIRGAAGLGALSILGIWGFAAAGRRKDKGEYCWDKVEIGPEANQLGEVWSEQSQETLSRVADEARRLFATLYPDKRMNQARVPIFPLTAAMADEFKKHHPELADLIEKEVPVSYLPETAQAADSDISPGVYWPGEFGDSDEETAALVHSLFPQIYGLVEGTGRFSPDGAAREVTRDVVRMNHRIISGGDTWESVAQRFCLNPDALQAANPEISGELEIGRSVCLPLPLSVCR